MNALEPSRNRRCRACGAWVESTRGGEICLRCALGHALKTDDNAAAGPSIPVDEPISADVPLPPSALKALGFHRFGDYELLQEIARGGMGVVYKARQLSLNRIVAVKMLLFGPQASKEYVQRFRTEATAAGSLQHPHIVSIHEVGIYQGQQYLVMDFVNGPPLSRLVGQQPLPAGRAAGYLKTIAEAVHYAHEHGILHRDLKPSNVLIDEFDQPRITDFGLAKRLAGGSELTVTGHVLGSPNYMPPEQVAAQRGKVSRRSDVYALGAMLYHLLTGRAPFVAETVTETLHLLLETDPIPPRWLNPSVPRDLETVCLQCLEKDPAYRYATAQAVADELGRFLRYEPIQARPITRIERMGRWCRRKPMVATLAASVVLIFVLGFAGVLWQAHRASNAMEEAQRQREKAQAQHYVAEGRLYAAQMKLAYTTFKEGKIGGALSLVRAQKPGPGEPDFRGFDWRYLYGLCLSSRSEVIASDTNGFQSVAYSPDGATLALGTGAGSVGLFDAWTLQNRKSWHAHSGAIDHLAFHPRNNNWLATVSGDDGIVKLWDITHERLLCSTQGARGMMMDFAFSPGGEMLATRAPDAHSIDLWEFQRGLPDTKPTLTLKTNLGFWGPVAFSRDGRILALCNHLLGESLGNVALYDLVNGRLASLPAAHQDFVYCAGFSPDGSRLATGGADERVVLWDVKRQTVLNTFQSDFLAVSSVAFTPDGLFLFASSWDQNIRCWKVVDPMQTQVLHGHSAAVNRLALAPDGRSLASASSDGTARLWILPIAKSATDPEPREESAALFSSQNISLVQGEPLAIYTVAVSPTVDLAVAAENSRLILCDLATGTVPTIVPVADIFPTDGPGLCFHGLALSPNGRELAVGSSDGRVAFLEADTLKPLRVPMRLHDNEITHIAYAMNGAVLVTGGGLGTGIKLTDLRSGRILTNINGLEGSFPLQPLAVSPDGERLATGSPEGQVCVRDIASYRLLASSPHKVRFLHAVTFAPDGVSLAFADEKGAVLLWDVRGQRPFRKFAGHNGPVNALAFSADGRTLASGGMDHTIRLWNPDIDQEVAILKGHSEWLWSIAFAQHDQALLSGGRDGTLRLWRAPSFEQIEKQERTAASRGRTQ